MNSVVPLNIGGQKSLKQAAIDYARMGFSVFPIKAASKAPAMIKEWPVRATSIVSQVDSWWTVWPQANIGIVTGQKSGFFVLDIDAKNGGFESIATLVNEYGELPETSIQTTGSGKHYLFQCNAPVSNSASLIAPGIDIRGNGGYIVAAPSVHPDGLLYSWIRDPRKIAEAPSWLVDRVNYKSKPDKLEGPIPKGRRNEALFRNGCTLRKQGKRAMEIGSELFRINEYRCQPPLSDLEVNAIISNVNRYINSEKKPLFLYRDFIRTEAPKNAILRLILHSISFYMDVYGKPAFPTEDQLAEDTALTRETICRNLKKAEKQGLIVIKRHKAPGQRYPNNVYMLPKRFVSDSEE